MDKAIQKKSWPASRIITLSLIALVVIVITYMVIDRSGSSRLKVSPERLMTAQVKTGEFREYYPFDGTVEPLTAMYLDIEEGGRVEEIILDGGEEVKQGDLILRLSNTALERSTMETETRLLENLDMQRTTQFNRAESRLILKDQLLTQEYGLRDLKRVFKRSQNLVQNNAISQEDFDKLRDEVEYREQKVELLKQRIEQQEALTEQQLVQTNRSIERLSESLERNSKIVEKLEIRAPISGFLSNVSAQLGQSLNRGQRIGQIDQPGENKISVGIDQYYISRVQIGTAGHFDLDGETYQVAVSKIYPEVIEDKFVVDLEFRGQPPSDLRRGQRLTVELSFSEPTNELMVAKGGFFQQTGGRWVYLVSDDGLSAHRTSIRLGRQNPRFVEVLEGLREGDWIISSGYDTFNAVDELRFSEPLQKK